MAENGLGVYEDVETQLGSCHSGLGVTVVTYDNSLRYGKEEMTQEMSSHGSRKGHSVGGVGGKDM
jgi:hypothetical protein